MGWEWLQKISDLSLDLMEWWDIDREEKEHTYSGKEKIGVEAWGVQDVGPFGQ